MWGQAGCHRTVGLLTGEKRAASETGAVQDRRALTSGSSWVTRSRKRFTQDRHAAWGWARRGHHHAARARTHGSRLVAGLGRQEGRRRTLRHSRSPLWALNPRRQARSAPFFTAVARCRSSATTKVSALHMSRKAPLRSQRREGR